MPKLVSLTHPSLQILEKSRTGVFSTSRHLVKFLINKNCDNSRTWYDTDMKRGSSIIKIDKKKKHEVKTTDNVVLANYDVIVLFPIHG